VITLAHFAEVDDSGIVRQVIVIDNKDCGGGDYPASNAAGKAFIASIGLAGNWEQTSYSGSHRGTYAGQGFTFDAVNDVFVAPVAPDPTPE
tara:strand:+ start:501 stop:773 length:273 start_codon:yes stop_codon:yes gene_type:complete